MTLIKYITLKNKYRKALLALAIIISTFAVSGSTALAAKYAPGCYADTTGKAGTCAAGAKDTASNTVDSQKYCYVVQQIPGTPASSDGKTPAVPASTAYNQVSCDNLSAPVLSTSPETAGNHQCGSGSLAVHIAINFGCHGEACVTNPPTDPVYCAPNANHNAIVDIAFAIIRFLSLGVGIIVIASIVVAGIQYTTSRGDPNATAKATQRIRSSVIALLVYIFAYAILNYVIPAGFFKQ
jgi:hypothetical protein